MCSYEIRVFCTPVADCIVFRVKPYGVVHAWLGQIVTFFAYSPPSRPLGSLTPKAVPVLAYPRGHPRTAYVRWLFMFMRMRVPPRGASLSLCAPLSALTLSELRGTKRKPKAVLPTTKSFGSLQTEARVKISHSFGLISQNYLYPRRDGGARPLPMPPAQRHLQAMTSRHSA